MNVKEDIAVLLCFKHTAAIQTAADDLEGLHQIVFDIIKFKFADLFHKEGDGCAEKVFEVNLKYNPASDWGTAVTGRW